MSLHYHQESFNGGNFAPLLHLRVGLEKHRSAMRASENVVVTQYGAVTKRDGTVFFGACATHRSASRLIAWQVRSDVGYVIEFAVGVARVIFGGRIVATFGHPYGADELFEVQYVQVNDVGYFVHPRHEPRKLVHFSPTSWSFDVVVFGYAPMREAVAGVNLTAGDVYFEGGLWKVNLTTDRAFFVAGHVGAAIGMTHKRGAGDYSRKIGLSGSGVTAAIAAIGNFSFYTTGNWSGSVAIQQQVDGVWRDVRVFASNNDQNWTTVGTVSGDGVQFLRLEVRGVANLGNGPIAVLEVSEGLLPSLVKVEQVLSPTMVKCVLQRNMGVSGAALTWSEGAFSGVRGYPRTVAIHDQRLIFGGTPSDRQTFWGSASDDYERFEAGTKDDESFRYTLASGAHDEIQWMASQKSLLIGTSGGEWVVASGGDEGVLTPSNARARRQSNYGSAYQQAVIVDDAAMFLRIGGERLAQMSYYFEKDGYASDDLTTLSYDLGRSGFVQLAYKRKREPMILGVLGNGGLGLLTYNRGQEVRGWTSARTEGFFESVCVVSNDEDEDEVWVSVRRLIGGVWLRYLERFQRENGEHVERGDLRGCVFLDGAGFGVSVGGSKRVFGGFGHLEGVMVSILADGATHAPKLVVNGRIELDTDAEVVVAGIAYSARVVPLILTGNGQNGTILGRNYKIVELVVWLYRTISLKYGARGAGVLDDLPFRTGGRFGEPIELFTGAVKVKPSTRHDVDTGVELVSDEPFPWTLVGLTTVFNYEGGDL